MERYRVCGDAAVYFVTYSVVDWLPVFASEATCRIVTESLNFCHREKALRTSAYVVMPTHFHGIFFDADRLVQSLADLRKFTGRQLCDYCDAHMPTCFAQTLRESSTADRQRRFWQPSRHPEAIESEWFWSQKMDYLHENPCRKGLVLRADHWRFSSAAYWLSDGQERSDVMLSGIVW
jgi:hypothetical protein